MDPRPRRILSTACVAVLALTSACSWGGSDDGAPADGSAEPTAGTAAEAAPEGADSSGAETLDLPLQDAPGAPDLRNASLPLPKGCVTNDSTTASFANSYASASDSTGMNAFAYLRHPATVMSTSTGPLTLVPLECHRGGTALFHTDIAAYTETLSLAGSISLRDIDSGAEAGMITSITTSEGAAHLEWVNQEISGDRECHLCSTGVGNVDLSWKGDGFTASGLRTGH